MNKIFANIFDGLQQHTLSKNQLLISPGELPRGVFFIHSGYIKSYDITPQGECQVIAIYGPDEIVPLYWALDGKLPKLFHETMCTTRVSIMQKQEFKSQIGNNIVLLQIVLSKLLNAFYTSQERIQNLELRTAKERIAFRLLFLAKHFGHKKGDTCNVDVPIIYQDLAETVNVTRETVNRVMRQLINEGIVARADHHVDILKLGELRMILDGDTLLDS